MRNKNLPNHYFYDGFRALWKARRDYQNAPPSVASKGYYIKELTRHCLEMIAFLREIKKEGETNGWN